MIAFGFWVAGLLGKTLTRDQAKRLGAAVAIPLAVIAAVLLFWAGKAIYDHNLKQRFQNERDATVAIDARKADHKADAALAKRAAETKAENDRLEAAMADAKAKDPAKGTTPVGPVQQSYFDNLPKKKR